MSFTIEEIQRQVKPYLARGDEMEGRNPLVSFYCRIYVAEKLLELRKDTESAPIPGLDQLLMDTMDAGDRVKPANGIPQDGPRQMEDFALMVFMGADNEDRSGTITVTTARRFYAASLFLDVLEQFGPLPPDLAEKQKYAKWKAGYINKCLKEGVEPMRGSGEEPEQGQANDELSQAGIAPPVAQQDASPIATGSAVSYAKDSDGFIKLPSVPQMEVGIPPAAPSHFPGQQPTIPPAVPSHFPGQQPQEPSPTNNFRLGPPPDPITAADLNPAYESPANKRAFRNLNSQENLPVATLPDPETKVAQHFAPPQATYNPPVNIQVPGRTRQQAKKTLTHAVSALDHNDVPTAVAKIMEALNILNAQQ